VVHLAAQDDTLPEPCNTAKPLETAQLFRRLSLQKQLGAEKLAPQI